MSNQNSETGVSVTKEATKKQGVSVGVFIQQFSPILILLLLIIVMSFANENFLQVSNFINIIRQTSILGVMAMGMTLVILTAGIDLSVGSLMAVAATSMAVAATAGNVPAPLAVLLGVVCGTALGVINGLVITIGKIQPFIATLGMMTAAGGIALLITDGMPITGIPASMLAIGSQHAGRIPISVFVFAAVALISWVLLSKTSFGRNIYAIGGNSEAARTSGIRVERTMIVVYAISGFFCSIAGIVLMGRINSANALMGSGMELNAITAVALGGTSLAGRFGSVGGTVIGVMTIGVLNNGLDLMDVSAFWQRVILGTMIILVVILDAWRKRKFE